MDYTFKMLRNDKPVENYETAVACLDAYTYHLIGQPLAIRYYKDAEHTDVGVIYAIGIRNHYDLADNDSLDHGPDFYRIIGGESNTIFWEKYEQRQLEESDMKFRAAEMTPEEFDDWVQHAIPNVVSFVYDQDSDTGKLYKGDRMFGSTDLLDMKLGDTVTINDIDFDGDIENIIETILNNVKSYISWKVLCGDNKAGSDSKNTN